jgi:hypothetical protein
MEDEDTANDASLEGLKIDSTSKERLQALVEKLLKPYLVQTSESVRRTLELHMFALDLEVYGTMADRGDLDDVKSREWMGRSRIRTQMVPDILRAEVVLMHAYLEDFLRTVAAALLPESDESGLNSIPLAGVPGRSEKFALGKLVQHKGKSVDDVLRESVSEYLDRSTFNNKGEIVELLKKLGFDLSHNDDDLAAIQQMIQRRHQIVHRADRVKAPGTNNRVLQPIDRNEVLTWMKATERFMKSLYIPLLDKLIPLEAKKPDSSSLG